jgi:hypothetical protein
MIYALAILIITAAVCYALGFGANRDNAARIVALVGVTAALVVALVFEGLQGGGTGGAMVVWPDYMSWLGASSYWSDTLAASLGAWCILIGGLCLLKLGEGADAPRRLAASTLMIATLYSLVYTADLRAFAAQLLLLVLLTWAVLWDEGQTTGLGSTALTVRQRAAQTAGALSLLVSVLLIGRTTGGVYTIEDMSLSALTFWPLLLIVIFIVFWTGLVPFTGWSGLVQGNIGDDTRGTLVQGLVLAVPVIVLVLRLQALITNLGIAGSVPPDWRGFTGAMVWLGGITTLTAAASTVVWAGTTRWSVALTAYVLGSAIWALGLDTPTGRYAAIAIVLAYAAGRLVLDLSTGQYDWLSRLAAGLSLVGAPLTAGFVGIWLLASGLVESRHASLAIVVAGAAIVAACGAALHLGAPTKYQVPSTKYQVRSTKYQVPSTRYEEALGYLVLGTSYFVLVVGGALPGLWLPQVEAMAGIAGGSARLETSWTGLMSAGIFLPLTLLAGAALVLAAFAWLLRLWMKSRTAGNSVLLPTAVARLQKLSQGAIVPQSILSNPPPVVWWLSLVWLERGIYGSGSLLSRISTRLGTLLARLEGRYYFPLALILTLLIILAITR